MPEKNIRPVFTPLGSEAETGFLSGPRTRWKEFTFLLRVLFEFIHGFRKLHFLGPCVTVFGSARFDENHPYYQLAQKMGSALSSMGFTVMTGGGPGIMEAANRGAKEAGGLSIGCNIVLPMEQHPNPYLDEWVNFDFFFVRKVLLSKYSYAFIVMPGGFGTLDEFFEALTLIQTRKTPRFPVVVMGCDYHKNLIEHMAMMEKEKTISPEDEKLILFTDSVEEAVQHLNTYAVSNFNLKKKSPIKPSPILGEKRK